MTTSPPRPPSPPEGPPRGTNFSRRNAMQPLPPSPPRTRTSAESMNMDVKLSAVSHQLSAGNRPPTVALKGNLGFCRFDRDDAAVAAPVVEPHDAGDFREERVVPAAAHVRARKEFRAALPDEDRAARDELPAEALHAEPLRVGVAAV